MPLATQPTSAQAGPGRAAAVLDDLMSQRRSCRGFRPEPLDRAVIEEVLRTASRSASWCNTQPWHVHVVSGDAARELSARLVSAALETPEVRSDVPFPASYDGVLAERRRAAGWALYESLGIERGDRAASGREMLRNLTFFGAPHVAILTTAASLGPYGGVDCGIFVQSVLLAARARGVASIAQASLAAQSPTIREFLGLPGDRQVLLGIALGTQDDEHPSSACRTDRVGLDELATFVDRA